MNLAVVSPWPHQASGIADCAYATVWGLVKYSPCKVTVYTTNDSPVELEGVEIKNLDLLSQEYMNYDMVVVHMGNNKYHSTYLDIIKNIPCVVHIHDLVLHHLFAGMTHGCRRQQDYLDEVSRWYGEEAGAMIKALLTKGVGVWDTDIVIECPMFEPFLQYASGCLVSSRFAESRINNVFPKLPTRKIHLMNQIEDKLKATTLPVADSQRANSLKVGVFGFVAKNKKVDAVLEAIAKLDVGDQISLHVVGGFDLDECDVRSLVDQHGLSSCVHFHGRVENGAWLEMMASMDLVVALRHPTMGETSGVVTDALSLCVPTVVCDTGSYTELPGFVKKVSLDNMVEDLREYLDRVLNNTCEMDTIKSYIREYNRVCGHEFKAQLYYKSLLELREVSCKH